MTPVPFSQRLRNKIRDRIMVLKIRDSASRTSLGRQQCIGYISIITKRNPEDGGSTASEDDRGSIPGGRAGNISLRHRVQTSSGAHTASYPMGTRGTFPGDKEAGT
jgi:hypothetical protein